MVSLRVVMGLTVAVVATVAVVVSFVPTYLEGVKALRSTMTDLRGSYVHRAQDGVNAFFDKPYQVLLKTEALFRRQLINYTDVQAFEQFMVDSVWHNHETASVVHFQILASHPTPYPILHRPLLASVNNSAGSVVGTPSFAIVDTRFYPTWPMTVLYGNSTGLEVYTYDNLTHTATVRVQASESSVAVETIPEKIYSANPTQRIYWSGSQWGYDSAQLTIFNWVTRPDVNNGNTPVALFGFDILPKNLNNYFASLDLRSRSRACLIDADKEGVLLGNSWGEKNQEILDLLNTLLPGWERLQLKTISNLTDSTVTKIVAELSAETVLTTSTPFSTSLFSGHDTTFVDIVEVTAPGLRLRVLLIMPEMDFLEEIYRTQVITIVVMVSLVFLLVLGGIGVVHLITKPLLDLRVRMQLTANLQESETSLELSSFSEVSEMQASYLTMCDQLNKLKCFVPQSVLATLNATSDDDDEGDYEGTTTNPDGRSGVSNAKYTTYSRGDSATYRSIDPSRRPSEAHSATGTVKTAKSSDDRSSRRGGVHAVAALNLSSTIAKKNITVAVFNLTSFHSTVASSSEAVSGLQKVYLEVISETVKQNKGVIDVFQGDRVVCTFNAVSSTPAHAKRAVTVARTVTQELLKHKTMPFVKVGISSGPALCGNMGTDAIRRFNIISPVVPQAFLLERLTKYYQGSDLLVSAQTLSDISLDFKSQVVDIIQMPTSSSTGSGGKPQAIAAVMEPKVVAPHEEWMYEVKEGEEKDQFAILNNAFFHLLEGGHGDQTTNYVEESRKCLTKALSLVSNSPTTQQQQQQASNPSEKEVVIREVALRSLNALIERAADKDKKHTTRTDLHGDDASTVVDFVPPSSSLGVLHQCFV